MKKKLIDFIINNKLNFTGRDSSLNSEACILCGYSLYIGVTNVNMITEAVKKQCEPSTLLYQSEIQRVYNFAVVNNYGNWWKTEEASKMYKF